MRSCPECGKEIAAGPTCRACGYTERDASGRRPIDPTAHRCADEFNGQRCAAVGRFTESTLGSDRWYCDRHFYPFRAWSKVNAIAPPPCWKPKGMKPMADLAELAAERIAIESQDNPLT